MTNQEIKELAGHREVPPWVMKLVADAVAMERERTNEKANSSWTKMCTKMVEAERYQCYILMLELHSLANGNHNHYHYAANKIQERAIHETPTPTTQVQRP